MTKDNKGWRENAEHLFVRVVSETRGEVKKSTMDKFVAFIEQTISKELEKQKEEILRQLPIEDNKVFGVPVVVSDNPEVSSDYGEGFTNGFNEAIRQMKRSIENK